MLAPGTIRVPLSTETMIASVASALASMSAVTEHVQQRTGEEQEEWQRSDEMGAMFRDEEEAGDRKEANQCQPHWGASRCIAHGYSP